MTIKKRLARSNIAMLAIPLMTAAVLAALAACGALVLLRGDLAVLHDAVEQAESVLHGFKLTLCLGGALLVLLVLASVALTNLYLTRRIFRHISRPLDILTAGVARIRDGDLSAPIAYTQPDEFRAVCDAVDEMAARLKASLEQQQAEKQKKQELIAGMSHDLKSPLTSIRAYSEALLEGVARDEAARQRYLQTIHTKALDMESMVGRLFAFAKTDLSSCPAHIGPLPLERVIRELTDEWDSQGMEIQTDIPPELRVLADRELLGRITANLLGNSLKYGGRELVHMRVSAAAADGMAEIAFSDDGPGVPEEQLPRLFDAFYRGDTARTMPSEGSGLGLAVVKKSVEEMGGQVRAENRPEGGLRIVFTLPIAKEDAYA